MDTQAITQNMGGEWRHGSGIAPCPVCQPEQRKDQRALSIATSDGRLLLYCHKTHCRFADILKSAGIEAVKTERSHIAAPDPRKLSKARALWEYAKPVSGTKAEAYLRGRCITCDLPETLRFAPDIYHAPSGQFCSATIASVSTGGVHRTFLDKRTGQKLKSNAKMMLGPCAGGAVHLSQGAGSLVVCEGIETGLSLLSGILASPASVWACLSTSGLRSLTLPKSVGRLIIATDGDNAGQEAGDALGARAARLGWDVEYRPAPMGQDWNDVLCVRATA